MIDSQRNNELAEILYWLAKLKQSSMELFFQSIRPQSLKTTHKINLQKNEQQNRIFRLLFDFPQQLDISIPNNDYLFNPHIDAYLKLQDDIRYFVQKYLYPLPKPIFNSILLLIYQGIKQHEIEETKLAYQEKRGSFHQKRKQQIQSINRLIASFGQNILLNYAFLLFCYQINQNETRANAFAAIHQIRIATISLLRKVAFKLNQYPKYVWRVDTDSDNLYFSLHLLATGDIDLRAFIAMFNFEFENYQQKKQIKQPYWAQFYYVAEHEIYQQNLPKTFIQQRLQPSWIALCYDFYHRKGTYDTGSLKRPTKK